MSLAHRSFRSALCLAALPLLAACGSAPSSDAGGTGTDNAADTAPVSCPSGTIHPRVCTMPLSGAPSPGDYAIDVNNDVNAACPDGYTLAKDSTDADGICCVVPSATDITECAEPWNSDSAVSSEVWTFAATQCTDTADAGAVSWAAAHPDECGDDALDNAQTCDTEAGKALSPQICATAAPIVHVPWGNGSVQGP